MSINKENVKDIKLIDDIIDGTQNIAYDNLTSGLTATTIKAAIDEVAENTGEVTNLHYYVKAYTAIAKGELIMFAGAQGDHILAVPCDATAPGFRPEWVMGVAEESLAIGAFGYVTAFGNIQGLDTSTYTLGDLLYMDSSTPGGFVTTEPTPPNHIILCAAVTNVHQNQGSLQIRLSHKPDTDEVPEGSSNLYYTDARADARVSAGISALSTNLAITGNTLQYTNVQGVQQDIDLSPYLDDTTNTVLSAVMSGNTVTFTREDSTTFTVDIDLSTDIDAAKQQAIDEAVALAIALG